MRYLIVSDIHGCLPALEQVLAFYEKTHCDMLCVLGDILNYGPRNRVPEGLDPQGIAARLNAMADQVIAVRGNCDAEVDQMLLKFPVLADYALLVDEGVRFFLTHGHIYNDQKWPVGKHDVLCYGHTHLWKLEKTPSGIVCNTGSVTFPKEGNPPTFAVYEKGKLSVHHLDGTLLREMTVAQDVASSDL